MGREMRSMKRRVIGSKSAEGGGILRTLLVCGHEVEGPVLKAQLTMVAVPETGKPYT